MAEHELGHCLGLGHASWDTDLMSPVVNDATEISDCHVEAVRLANAWKLVDDGADGVYYTAPGSVICL